VNAKTEKDNGADVRPDASLYPYTSLEPSLKISDAVKELGGARSAVSKSRLAAHLNESEKSPSFLQRISSAKAFGLIVGRSDYSLSDVAKRYYSPTTEQDRSNALLDFLTAPSSFREIIGLFDGEQLPKREILANIFSEKLKVPESWKDRAAGFFENSAQFVGVIDENRFLRFKATQHAAARKPVLDSIKKADEAISSCRPIAGSQATPEGAEQHTLYLSSDKKRMVTLVAPLTISNAEYTRICNWIKVALIVEENENQNT
jgi:hypothetical protein